MPKKIYLASCRRPLHAGALLLSGLLVLVLAANVLAANGWFARVAAASDAVVTDTEVTPTRVSPFDSEMNMTASSAGRQKCTSVASVRWVPNSTVTVAYARGDFTDAERDALHKAISLWQRALAQTNVGIVLEESGEINKDIEPARSQIIIRRDYSMDSRYYGKIMASTRPDNYVERATILINGSLHKRSSLRKTLLHELGHGFGLRDCAECGSGATVMNYFSQQSVIGFKVWKGNRISDQPTACDISQITNGYRQSPPPRPKKGEDESENSRTVVADEMVAMPDAKSSNSDDNIIAPYLNSAAALEANGAEIPAYLKPAVLKQLNLFAIAQYPQRAPVRVATPLMIAPYDKPSTFKEFKLFAIPEYPPVSSEKAGNILANFPYMNLLPIEEFNLFANPPHLTAKKVKPLATDRYVKAAPVKERNLLSIPLYPQVNSAKEANVLAPYFQTPPHQRANAFAVASYLKPALVPEVNVRRIDTGVLRKEGLLNDAEKTELESSLPTLLNTEAETMEELNNYTFKRDVLIQTIDSKGRVSGEYHRVSDMLFDDSGARIERGLFSSKPTLRRLKISPEYIEDFSGAQLKGFELSKRDHYRIEPFMTDIIDGVGTRVYRITPLNLSAERAAQARVFYGFAWVDEKTGKIIKIKGCALPDDKQRYPMFETHREVVDGVHLFPARTIADDYLVFPSHTVHIRMLIIYSDYKSFASRVTVTEVDGN
jgi:hypothetical protein